MENIGRFENTSTKTEKYLELHIIMLYQSPTSKPVSKRIDTESQN